LVLKKFVPISENTPEQPEMINITMADVPQTNETTIPMKIKIKKPKKTVAK
jgi:hypothetical protein